MIVLHHKVTTGSRAFSAMLDLHQSRTREEPRWPGVPCRGRRQHGLGRLAVLLACGRLQGAQLAGRNRSSVCCEPALHQAV